MPVDYPVEQLMADIMDVIQDNMVYIVPSAILIAAAAFIVRWFMYAINIGEWTFGKRQ